MDDVVWTDKDGHPIAEANEIGVRPIFFNETTLLDIEKYLPGLMKLSMDFWTYLGYTGISTPWHDASDPFMIVRHNAAKLRGWFSTLAVAGIDWYSYSILSLALGSPARWDRTLLLYNDSRHMSWMRRLRSHAGSSALVDATAAMVMEFIQLQVEFDGRAHINEGSLLRAGFEGGKPFKYLEGYHALADRIRQLSTQGVDSSVWLRAKFTRAKEAFPNQPVLLRTISNFNAFDPDLNVLKAQAADEWRYLREFLHLDPECSFPYGSIPKGWRPASGDPGELSKIARIHADGYYYYADGTQRKGKRHYATNKYLVIQCTPSNFLEFQSEWDDSRLMVGRPRRSEYQKYALYPNIWDESGKNVSGYPAISDIKWRKG